VRRHSQIRADDSEKAHRHGFTTAVIVDQRIFESGRSAGQRGTDLPQLAAAKSKILFPVARVLRQLLS
jgi:hypothetical protein